MKTSNHLSLLDARILLIIQYMIHVFLQIIIVICSIHQFGKISKPVIGEGVNSMVLGTLPKGQKSTNYCNLKKIEYNE